MFTNDLAIQYYTLPLLSPPTVCGIGGKICKPKHTCSRLCDISTIAHSHCEEIEKPRRGCRDSGCNTVL